MKKEDLKMTLNLQFFAEGDDGDEGSGGTETNDSNNNANSGSQKKDDYSGLASALGFNSLEEMKQALLSNKQQSTQTEGKKDTQGSDTATESKKVREANERAEKAEAMLSCVKANVKKEVLDDVLAIAKNKITEDKNLDAVLLEMSKQEVYEKFFSINDGASTEEGTGSDVGHMKDKNVTKKGKYGAKLASSTIKQTAKSSYF